ncbi:hypothetical protein ACP4OV_013728 [Aristida adscensionis]
MSNSLGTTGGLVAHLLYLLDVILREECSFYSVVAALESNLRLHRRFTDNLSIRYLKSKHRRVVLQDPDMKNLGRVERLLKILKDTGAPSEAIYNLIAPGHRPVCPVHRISGYKKYLVSRQLDIRYALETHLKKGPMLAVFYLSGNYHNCMKSGAIYRFTGVHVLDANHRATSHCVCVISFGIEETVPFFMFRTEVLGKGWLEYGRVEIQSVIEFYGIDL